jgi:uncharacterized protein YecE (DUF72 family)
VKSKLRIGTCSWKYDSWRGIVYSESEKINYLEEYSKHFNTVEVDQWFWSLFSVNKVILPQESAVLEYKKSIPKDFKFTIKVPNAITLTHFYNKNKSAELIKNPHFLSNDLFNEFLESIEGIKTQVGCLMFQFEYLNKQKISSLDHFMEVFRTFHAKLPKKIPDIGIEIRNPNYLKNNYFEFLNSLNIYHVFLQGYYMPSIVEIYEKFKTHIKDLTVIRLHGEDRKGIEKISESNWNKIYIDRDAELKQIAALISVLTIRKVDVYLNINNHYEGSAPLSVARIKKHLKIML